MPKEGSKGKDMVWLEPFLKSVRSGGFVAGIRIPSLWVEGIHYVCSDRNQFEEGEPVIVNRSDGSKSVGIIAGDKSKSGEWLQFDLMGANLRVDVGEGLHKTVPRFRWPSAARLRAEKRCVSNAHVPLFQVGKMHQQLLDCVLNSGEGVDEERMLEVIEIERKKFMAHYGHLNAKKDQTLHQSSKSFRVKKTEK